MRTYSLGTYADLDPAMSVILKLEANFSDVGSHLVRQGFFESGYYGSEYSFNIEMYSAPGGMDGCHSVAVLSDMNSWSVVVFPDLIDQIDYLARILPALDRMNKFDPRTP